MAARRALKAVLVDLNGTLHIEDAAVPGAQEALKRQVLLQVQLTNMFADSVCQGRSLAEWMALRWHFTNSPYTQELP